MREKESKIKLRLNGVEKCLKGSIQKQRLALSDLCRIYINVFVYV